MHHVYMVMCSSIQRNRSILGSSIQSSILRIYKFQFCQNRAVKQVIYFELPYIHSSSSVVCDEVTSSTIASLTTMLGISLVGMSPHPLCQELAN